MLCNPADINDCFKKFSQIKLNGVEDPNVNYKELVESLLFTVPSFKKEERE